MIFVFLIYPANWLNSLIISNDILVKSLASPSWNIISSWNKSSFTLCLTIYMSLISFSCLNAMTPNKMLNRYTSGHLCLVPDLWAGVRGQDFSLSPLNVVFLCGFFSPYRCPLSHSSLLKQFPSITILLSVFLIKVFWISIKWFFYLY